MRISIDEHYSFFKWEFSFDGKIDTFKEQFTGKFWDVSVYYGFGEILANLMWVKSITQLQERNIKTIDFSPLKNFVWFADDGKELDSATVVYEALAKLAFVIYNQTRYCIQCIRDAKHRTLNKFHIIYSFMCDCLGYTEYNVLNPDPNICMEFLFAGLGEIKNLLTPKNNYNNQDIINSLAEMIKRYSANSKLIPRYQFERNDKDSGCVATYIFTQPQSDKNETLKGYIAFSGYNDCCNESLFKSINANSKKYAFPIEYIRKLHEIAKQLQLKLIVTNESICICKESAAKQVQIFTTLGQEISLGKNVSVFGNTFSCCERKIFTEFDNADLTPPAPKFGYYHGTLHVKFPPCELCDLSIQYEQQQNHKFKVVWYIKKL